MSGTKVLLIEDDPRIRRVLQLSLREEGYAVLEAATGAEGLARLTESPAVVLLDLMLPDSDGFDVCRSIRAAGNLPVIMVTARADSHDVVAGLEAGADDYVTKPFVAKEIAARIRALLRRARSNADPASPTVVGDLEICAAHGVVRRDGIELHLTKTEFRLLCELAAQPGTVVTREELLERVWGYSYFGDTRLLDVHIRRLREKIEHDPSHPLLVRTVRGIGYRLVGGARPADIAAT
jgi:DNA-binding response OmpR family regulator